MVEAQRLIDRYRLEQRLASGGMGTVYEATDERLQRRVAVKLLKEELADDPLFVERFRREARAVAALSHPNIASVFDYGADGGRDFIVMELLEGTDLAEVLQAGPLEPGRAAEIAAQACDALAHAHSAGIVHRDVKPANIILVASGTVKVTDFGIARALGDTTLTATGSVLGTAHYLAPEQASGSGAGAAVDQYAMGVMLYEMLTGEVPFSGDSPIGVAMRHVSDEVPAPSSKAPEVPAALDEVVLTATAKDPSDRYP
ncbi:MAG TPA: protein kinase, partial [Actinomycetota bacterium]|nr:protein kinase [Actinomycetota bacterium]